MLSHALVTTVTKWNQPTYPLPDEWILKWGIYTQQYIAELYRKDNNEIYRLVYGTGKIMLNDITQTKKDKCYKFSLICKTGLEF